MIVEHLPDGRTLLDAEALEGLTHYPRPTIRARCVAVAVWIRDGHRQRVALYEVREAEQALSGIVRRPRGLLT